MNFDPKSGHFADDELEEMDRAEDQKDMDPVGPFGGNSRNVLPGGFEWEKQGTSTGKWWMDHPRHYGFNDFNGVK